MWSFAYVLETSKLLELPQEVIENPQNYRIKLTGYSLNIPQALTSKPICIYCNIAANNFSMNGQWSKILGVVHALGPKPGRSTQRIPHPSPLELEITGGVSPGLEIYCDPYIAKGIGYVDIMKKECQ